jgi:hypothetical protein
MDMREITHDNLDYYFIYYHRGKGNQYIGWISLKKNYGTPTLHIFNTQNRLRYGTKYINKYNAQYREWSCTEDGDVLPGLVAKDTADNIEIRYGMR